jgi:hypothetical protein
MKHSSRPPRRLTILVALAGGVIAFGAFPRLRSQEPAATTRAQRQLSQRTLAARAATERALRAERELGARGLLLSLPSHGAVAVIADPAGLPGAAPDRAALLAGIADLLTSDLAQIRGFRMVERMQAQQIIRELALASVDASTAPRAGRLIGAGEIVMVSGDLRAGQLRLSARIVSVSRTSTEGTVTLAAAEGDIFPTERRLALSVARLLGHEPSAAERRSILDRPSTRIDAFLAYSAAVQAATDGELPRAEQLLGQALGLDASVNTAFDAAVLGAQLIASGASVVAAPTGQHETGEAPTDAGLATEGNDTEFGEAWFEGTGTRRLSVYEFAVPLTASIGLGRSRLDVSTTFASNRVDTPANDVFHASGFTDAFTRLSVPLAHSGVVAVIGAVLPTRSVSGVDDDIRRIPLTPDLLPMAMYQRRHAASGSLGLLTSRPIGAWAVGAAVAGEWTERFRQQEPSLAILSVAPGLRLRARVDAERNLPGDFRLALGSALMISGTSRRGGGNIRGGERLLMRASVDRPVGAVDLLFGGWWLRNAPVVAADTTLRDGYSVSSAFASARVHVGTVALEPGLEWKAWHARQQIAAQVLIPRLQADAPLFSDVRGTAGVEYVRGSLREPLDNRDVPVRGWLLRMGVQVER